MRISSSPSGIRIELKSADPSYVWPERMKLIFDSDHFQLVPSTNRAGKQKSCKTHIAPNGTVTWTFTPTSVLIKNPFNNSYELPYFRIQPVDRYLRSDNGTWTLWPDWAKLQPLAPNPAESRAGAEPPRGRPYKTEHLRKSSPIDEINAALTESAHRMSIEGISSSGALDVVEGPSTEELTTLLVQAVRNLNGVIKLTGKNPYMEFRLSVTDSQIVRVEFE